MKLIQAGDIMAADMGENIGWLAANMDQAFRVLAGAPIVEGGLETPLRVFDEHQRSGDAAGGFGDAFKYNYLGGGLGR